MELIRMKRTYCINNSLEHISKPLQKVRLLSVSVQMKQKFIFICESLQCIHLMGFHSIWIPREIL